jgi:hypothetical protein
MIVRVQERVKHARPEVPQAINMVAGVVVADAPAQELYKQLRCVVLLLLLLHGSWPARLVARLVV